MRIAVIGDIHGCFEELAELYNTLQWLSLDEIWCAGDIVDRGPDSGKCIDFCIKNNIKSVKGNHDDSIVNHYERFKLTGKLPRNVDKVETIHQINDTHCEWLKNLPPIHVFDKDNLIIVHGGVFPKVPLYAQPINSIIRLQMVHPDHPGRSRWWGDDYNGVSEEENVKAGWRRWYTQYDHEQNVIFGHSTFSQPMIYKATTGAKCIGVDTGSSFGGCLTACIYELGKEFVFVSVKNKRVYYISTTRSFWEAS